MSNPPTSMKVHKASADELRSVARWLTGELDRNVSLSDAITLLTAYVNERRILAAEDMKRIDAAMKKEND